MSPFIFEGEKVFADLRKLQIVNPHITDPQIKIGPANQQRAIFTEGEQIKQITSVSKVADLRLASLVCGPPTFAKIREDFKVYSFVFERRRIENITLNTSVVSRFDKFCNCLK
jgi:hypothetical protein